MDSAARYGEFQDGFPAIGEELRCCADCRLPYTCWYADNDLWNAVMRPVVWLTPEPYLCARCFAVRAEPLVEITRLTYAETPSRRDRERLAANGDAHGVDDTPSSPAVVAQSAPLRHDGDPS